MPVPIVYRKSGENALASYNYTDIAEGTGIVAFQGYNTGISGATTFHLTGNTFASFNIETQNTSWNFDLSPFNLPKTLKGSAIIRFSAYSGALVWFILTLQKVAVNGSVTDIGTATTTTLNTAAGSKNMTIKIEIALVNFKKGEKLRLNITPSVLTFIGHDPINRIGANLTEPSLYPSKLEVFIPFVIDI